MAGSILDAVFGTSSPNFEAHVCPLCGVHYGLAPEYGQKRREDGKPFHCPNGHALSYNAETEASKQRRRAETLERQLKFEREQAASTRENLKAANRSRNALRGINTRIKNRVSKGVCPCCNRYFANLHRHMAGQHPTFQPPASPPSKE